MNPIPSPRAVPVQTSAPVPQALRREPAADHARLLATGDLVEVGGDEDGDYRVVHISAGKAWVRPIVHGLQRIVPLSELRLVGSASGTVLLS